MDPLAQLKDIHLPAQIANYPLAPGWWIAAILLIALCLWLLLRGLQSYRTNKIKRQALGLLAKMNTSEENQNDNIMNLLKWAALQYFPRHLVAPLFGQQLQQFMTSCLPVKQQQSFTELSQSGFDYRYTTTASTVQDSSLKIAAKLWLTQALPPKKNSDSRAQQPAHTEQKINVKASQSVNTSAVASLMVPKMSGQREKND